MDVQQGQRSFQLLLEMLRMDELLHLLLLMLRRRCQEDIKLVVGVVRIVVVARAVVVSCC